MNDSELIKKKYERQSKRLDKILKQSDRQQLSLLHLNEKIKEQEKELRSLYDYDQQQQQIAKDKIDLTIVNELINSKDLVVQTINHAADILSGDFYSMYTLKDDSVVTFVFDAQGHGISPALTVFSVSSAISLLMEEDLDFERLTEKLFRMNKKFLGDIEQISYTIVFIDKNRKNMKYASGGMYPFFIKTKSGIVKYKANNLPFMNFSDVPKITSIELAEWENIFIYTDGLVEEDLENTIKFSRPIDFLNDLNTFESFKSMIKNKKFEDDITIVQLINDKVK